MEIRRNRNTSSFESNSKPCADGQSGSAELHDVWCSNLCKDRLDFSFVLDKQIFVLDKLSLIDIPSGSDHPLREISQIRGANGGLRWKVTQTGPQLASALNALQAQIRKATTQTLKDASDRVKVVKPHRFAITIQSHCYCQWLQKTSITCTDSAQGDRADGSSTGGNINGFWQPER